MTIGEVADKLRSMKFEEVLLPKQRHDLVLQLVTPSDKEIRVLLHKYRVHIGFVIKVAVIVPEWRNPDKRIEPRKFEHPKLMFDYINELLCAEVLSV